MALSLKPEHLKRYKDIARLLILHGRSDLVKAIDVELPDPEISQEITERRVWRNRQPRR